MKEAIIADACRIVVGGTLIFAATAKALDWTLFMDVLARQYKVHKGLRFGLGFLVPTSELVVGISILFRHTLPWSALCVVSLLVVFSLAVIASLVAGGDPGAWGCFGVWDRTMAGWRLIARNVGLAGLALVPLGVVRGAHGVLLYGAVMCSACFLSAVFIRCIPGTDYHSNERGDLRNSPIRSR